MSSAPPKTPVSSATFDLDYSIEDFEVDPNPDSRFLYRRIEALMTDESAVSGRVLDVACGVGALAMRARERGAEAWGIDASPEMLGLNRWVYPGSDLPMARSVAETLPFRDGSFDRVVCQGSLDHFVDPHAFMREAARVLAPDGRVVIALANYESLSCRLGRLWRRIQVRRGVPMPEHRPYWAIPLDHYHKGDLRFVKRLGGRELTLERCYGVSLLWLLRDSKEWQWGETLAGLPVSLANAILYGLDRIAYLLPGQADMIVSVWRRAEERR